MNDNWEDANNKFTEVINKKIGELGVNKNSYETKFKLLNIKDMQVQIKECETCAEGFVRCEEHAIKRKESFSENDPSRKRNR